MKEVEGLMGIKGTGQAVIEDNHTARGEALGQEEKILVKNEAMADKEATLLKAREAVKEASRGALIRGAALITLQGAMREGSGKKFIFSYQLVSI